MSHDEPKLYVMKWSTRESSYNHPDNHGKWVGIDTASGGYPWACEQFGNVEVFYSLHSAKGYQSSFPCLDIYELTLSLTPVK